MPERVSIYIDTAPKAFGHYSQVIKFGNQLFISGQVAIDPQTGKLVSNDPGEQAKAVFQSLTNITSACQGALSNIMMMTWYMTDLRDHKVMNEVSKEFFFFTPPARTTIQVSALPYGARLMVDAIADLNPPEKQKMGML